MNIQKISEEVTFKKITTEHEFLINDKKVRVYEHDCYDSISNDYDNDYDIDENDERKLTSEESEIFTDDVQELLKMEIGTEIDKS